MNQVKEKCVNERRKKAYEVAKRCMDFIMSLCAIIVLSPLFLLIAVAIYLDDPGPVIYGQKRVGKNGKEFRMWKFRSMYMNADQMIDRLTAEQKQQYYTEFKIDNDPRVTRVGKVIRKLSADELPQFVNVLCGEMSLVGPRPLLEKEIQTYYEDTRDNLLSVTPGVTGYWQAYARNNVTYESGERQKMEMHYIENASLFFDIKILFRTVLSVLEKSGAQ